MNTSTQVPHPARFSQEVLRRLETLLAQNKVTGVLLDPFAGVGGIHKLATADLRTVGVELEAEWAAMHPQTIVGDSTKLPFPDASFDAAASSPCYGNRMSDHHEARDGSKRITYRHMLGRPLSDNNSGAMAWGDEYRNLHRAVWVEVFRVLKPGGYFFLNISNHIRAGKEVPVVEWHIGALAATGFQIEGTDVVPTRRLRYGTNRQLRVNGERIITARKG